MLTHAVRLPLLAAALVFVAMVSAPAADAAGTEGFQTTLTKDGLVPSKLVGGEVVTPLATAGAAGLAKLADARPGDVVTITVDSPAAPTKVLSIDKVARPYPAWKRVAALVLAFCVIVGLAALATGGKPQNFLIGGDNRYSNSQSQLALWFGAMATAYLATIALRVDLLGLDFLGGVGIPEDLFALTGLSALSFGGARMITLGKIANAAAAPTPTTAKIAANSPSFPADLVQDDGGRADLGDFQMILVTLAAVTLFVLSAFHGLAEVELAHTVSLPDVDTTLLSGFGLAQAAYLVKKGASIPGQG